MPKTSTKAPAKAAPAKAAPKAAPAPAKAARAPKAAPKAASAPSASDAKAAALEKLRGKVVSSPSFVAMAERIKTAVTAAKPKARPAAFTAVASAVIDEGGSLPALCLFLEVEVLLWTAASSAEAMLTKLASAVDAIGKAKGASKAATSELRLLLRPVRELAAVSGIEAAAALEKAASTLPVHDLESFYDDEEGDDADLDDEDEEGEGEGMVDEEGEGDDDDDEELEEVELDDATAFALLSTMLLQAQEDGDAEGVEELTQLLSSLTGGGKKPASKKVAPKKTASAKAAPAKAAGGAIVEQAPRAKKAKATAAPAAESKTAPKSAAAKKARK